MKEYFEWVCEKCARLWKKDIDTVASMLMNGYPVPKAYSIENYFLAQAKKK